MWWGAIKLIQQIYSKKENVTFSFNSQALNHYFKGLLLLFIDRGILKDCLTTIFRAYAFHKACKERMRGAIIVFIKGVCKCSCYGACSGVNIWLFAGLKGLVLQIF